MGARKRELKAGTEGAIAYRIGAGGKEQKRRSLWEGVTWRDELE